MLNATLFNMATVLTLLNSVAAGLFSYRTARQWNVIQLSVLSKESLSSYKIAAKNFISL